VIEQESEELRLIYTAVTRTQGYVYVSASKNRNLRFSMGYLLPEHKIFGILKTMTAECDVSLDIPFDEEKDGVVRDYIRQKLEDDRIKKE
jgi:superfamily I DNA/RNA helicase